MHIQAYEGLDDTGSSSLSMIVSRVTASTTSLIQVRHRCDLRFLKEREASSRLGLINAIMEKLLLNSTRGVIRHSFWRHFALSRIIRSITMVAFTVKVLDV